LRVYLSRLLGEHKKKISDVTRDTGINRGTLTRMYYEDAERVDLEVLDILCKYFDCHVSELLEEQEPSLKKSSQNNQE
jgi:putative transcriptional regulator